MRSPLLFLHHRFAASGVLVHKRLIPIFLLAFASFAATAQPAAPQAAFVKPGDNLVIENIPPIPVSIADRTTRYGRVALQLELCPPRDAHRHPLCRHQPGPPGQNAGRRTRAAYLLT
jgi:hypothetical protein